MTAKLQIPLFGSSEKTPEHLAMFHYSQNSIKTLVGLLEFSYLVQCTPTLLADSNILVVLTRNQNSVSSSDTNILLFNDNRQCHYK